MKTILGPIIFFLIFNSGVYAQVETDKALHFLGGNLFGLAGAGIAKQASDGNRWWTFAGSIGGATLIGLGKEAIDSGQEGNEWDNDDLLATVLGGATVGVTIDIFTNRKKRRQRRMRGLAAQNGLKGKNADQQINRLDLLLKREYIPSLTQLSLPKALIAIDTLQ